MGVRESEEVAGGLERNGRHYDCCCRGRLCLLKGKEEEKVSGGACRPGITIKPHSPQC